MFNNFKRVGDPDSYSDSDSDSCSILRSNERENLAEEMAIFPMDIIEVESSSEEEGSNSVDENLLERLNKVNEELQENERENIASESMAEDGSLSENEDREPNHQGRLFDIKFNKVERERILRYKDEKKSKRF